MGERLGWSVAGGLLVLACIVVVVLLALRGANRMAKRPGFVEEGSDYVSPSETETQADTGPALGSEDEDDELVRIAWGMLKQRLTDGSTNSQPHPLGSGGRFHRRDGVQFTVVHTAPWYVIVRWKRGSDTVMRVLVNMNAPHVLCVEEEFDRIEKEGGGYTSRILEKQAVNASSPAAEPMSTWAILDLAAELPDAVYQGSI